MVQRARGASFGATPRRPLLLNARGVAIVVACVWALNGCSVSGGPPPPPPGGDWVLRDAFSDEFSGSSVNTTKWNTTVASWGNWTWDPSRVSVENGILSVSMAYDPHQRNGQPIFYKSGILKSTDPGGIAFGYFEARIKGAPLWPGVCPAFWAYRHDAQRGYWTELDFVEMLENPASPRDVDFTSHVFPGTPGVSKEISNSTHKVFDWDPRDDWHTYATHWAPDAVTWLVDGAVVKQLPAAPYFNRSDWPMDVTISFGLRPPLRSAPSPVGFPTAFDVDWVRVWQPRAPTAVSEAG